MADPSPEQLEQLGISTNAEPASRLQVKSDRVLFSQDDVLPGSSDMRQFLNRQRADKVASILFQTGYQ